MYTASDGFLYPPVAAAFFGLFGFIGTTLGRLLWCAINMFVYLVAILLVYRSGVLERVSARAYLALRYRMAFTLCFKSSPTLASPESV